MAVKHLLACGASHEAVVRAIEEIEAKTDMRSHWREAKRMSRMSEKSETKERPPHPQKKTTTPLDNPTGYLPPNYFDEFWAVYPRKIGKGAARKAYGNALKRATVEEILTGAKRYAATKPDPQFTKHASTWLNADCWLDEPDKPHLKTIQGGGLQFKPEPPKISYDEWKQKREITG